MTQQTLATRAGISVPTLHGFLRGPGGWRLAPAFDLNPNPQKEDHALALDDASHVPSVAAVRSTLQFYRLSKAAAARIEAHVRSAFDDWQAIARSIDFQKRQLERLEAVLEPSLDA
jgi:serine/threonine-protein kinase HipA